MDKPYIISRMKALSNKLGLEFDDEVYDAVIGFSEFKIYSKGSLLAGTGDRAAYAGIVMKGLIRSYYIDGDGNDITQFFSKEGSMCMDEGLMGFDEMLKMWEAIEETTVMLFDVKKMKELIFSSEKLKTVWIQLLESGMRYKMYRECGFLTENATERYIKFRRNDPDLAGRVQQRYIATYLGIKPESLSRIRSAMREADDSSAPSSEQ
ncbi:MAG: Crp/Fnr family transcriptional regulator [Oscillospiraceae bacterium]|nr:Crp/Fnr family transcriptional regulator [Oscillospiraceae bacterium]